jgi:hypothetical protein
MKKNVIVLITLIFHISAFAQDATDTVVIKVGDGSKVIFAIKDKKDLETMKKYNFQKLMDDMIYKLEVRDSSRLNKLSSEFLKKDSVKEIATNNVVTPVQSSETSTIVTHEKKYHGRRTRNSFNVDLGINNYVSNGQSPSQSNSLYTVHPWGSWYVGLNSIYRTRMASKFFLEWGGGVSWYNFKFQNDQVVMSKDDNGVYFELDQRNYNFTKSKLTAAFVNVSVVPVFDFGGNRRKPSFFDGHGASGFRIGLGPYAGYLLDSYTKQVHTEDGDKKKEVHHDNYYLTNLRYGVRLQLGFDEVDFFFNYDINKLFVDNKGPQLNAFSFGISF